MQVHFPAIGDKLKSDTQDFNFDKGEYYEIEGVYREGKKFKTIVTNRRGFPVLIDQYTTYKPTMIVSGKVDTNEHERMFRARVSRFFEIKNSRLYIVDGYNINNSRIFNFKMGLNVTFMKSTNAKGDEITIRTNAVSYNTKEDRKFEVFFWESEGIQDKPENVETLYFTDLDDFIKHLKGILKSLDRHKKNDWPWFVRSQPYSSREQEIYLDTLEYITKNNVPVLDESKIEKEILPEQIEDVVKVLSNAHSKYLTNIKDKSVQNWLNGLAFIFWDECDIQSYQKEMIRNIIKLYLTLPSSHGATSVAKILKGRSKLKNEKIEQYKGMYSDWSYPKLFSLVQQIDIYLYENKVFEELESYSSGNEWRGDFEFIGSYSMNIDVLQPILNKI